MAASVHAPANRPAYRKGDPVALFVPCYVDQLYPQIGTAVVILFARLGVPLVYPEEQTCCGQPAFNSGYWEEARPVVRHFARTFAPYSSNRPLPIPLILGCVAQLPQEPSDLSPNRWPLSR